MKSPLRKAVALALAAGLAPMAAHATNGYFKLGYGTKQFGMGGAGVAYPQDSIAAASNPAGMAFVGSRADIGVQFFSPKRDATFAGTNDVDSGATLFAIPNLGAVVDRGSLAYGVSVYANGGMNTRYDTNLYDNAFGPLNQAANMVYGVPLPSNTGTLGVNLSQVIIAPTVAYKVLPSTAIGVSALIGIQGFRAYGLGDFANPFFSSDPSHVTNQGNDYSYGGGVRVGFQSNLTDWLSVGGAYSSKIYMTKLDKYKGLFADGGSFDIPASYAVGLALKPTQNLVVAVDAQRIMYNQVAAIGNPGPSDAELGAFVTQFQTWLGGGAMPSPLARGLGTANGMGFGWQDITVYKLGVAYQVNDRLTVRAGFDYTKSPIPNNQLLFNILAPGVIKYTGTLGLTYKPASNQEINVAYMHAARHNQSANSPLFGHTEIGMYQNAVEVGYAWQF